MEYQRIVAAVNFSCLRLSIIPQSHIIHKGRPSNAEIVKPYNDNKDKVIHVLRNLEIAGRRYKLFQNHAITIKKWNLHLHVKCVEDLYS